MKTSSPLRTLILFACSAAGIAALHAHAIAQVHLADALVSYWPLDVVIGDKTPDLMSGYDLSAYVSPGHALTNGSAIVLVAGYKGNCASFDSARQTLLAYTAGPDDDLPINKHTSLTIAFWANAPTAQVDRRLFSEGNLANNNPLFNIGTSSSGSGVDLFFRQQPSATELAAGYGDFGAGAHLVSGNAAYDSTWHHVVLVQQPDGTRTLYIDGVADPLSLPAKPGGAWNVNATSIGGILRSSAAAWVTGLVDEVALWKRALTVEEITELKNNGLNSVFPPLAVGMVSHWPLDVVIGDKTPDLVSGYDLSAYVGPGHVLTNGNAIQLVTGYRGNCASFDNARQILLAYQAGQGDELPINKHLELTISFWANAPTAQIDRRLFSEGNLANNNPLFNIGTSSSGSGVDLFFRQQPTTEEIAAGYGNFGAGAHLVSGSAAYDSTWHHVALVQTSDGTRTLYIDALPDSLSIPAKPAGAWNVNATSVGGILRSSAAAWVSGLIDEVAVWKRALSPTEIADLKTSGVPPVPPRKLPLQIRRFEADRQSVAQGDTVALSWDASFDAVIAVSPGVGNVTAISAFGVGSTSVVVNATTTFTLTASRGSESTNRIVTVYTVSGVATGWRVIENFEELAPGHIGGQAGWINALTAINGPLRPARVVDTGVSNKFLGFDSENVLAAKPLNSMTVGLGQTNTLFFRFFIFPEAATGTRSDIEVRLGLTEKGLRDVSDFRDGNNGPSVVFFRQGGGPIDLMAPNGFGATASTYSYLADTVNNPSGAGLVPGTIYNVWMDVENRPYDIVGGVQNGGDRYSVHIQKQGNASRTTLFSNFLSDRDGVADGGVLGNAIEPLTHLYFVLDNQTTQTTNKIRFDDFFLSRSGTRDTVPYAPGAFVPPLKIIGADFPDLTGLTLTWNSLPGKSYTVQRKFDLNGSWETLESSFPPGGATEETTKWVDIDFGFFPQSFYQIIENP
jgi:hypothetical protein